MVGKHSQVGVGHHHLFGKGPGVAHADQLARAAKMMIVAVTGGTVIAGHERVDCHPLSGERSGQRRANRLMSQNERRDSALVMAVPGMHVGPADSTKGQIDDALATCRDGCFDIAQLTCVCTGIDKCFHFAVNPPSTIRTCPVT